MSKLRRSVRLKKYAVVYKEYVTESKKEGSELNDYQKFVKEESKKEKYKKMKGSERLLSIAEEWEKRKKKRGRKKKEK